MLTFCVQQCLGLGQNLNTLNSYYKSNLCIKERTRINLNNWLVYCQSLVLQKQLHRPLYACFCALRTNNIPTPVVKVIFCSFLSGALKMDISTRLKASNAIHCRSIRSPFGLSTCFAVTGLSVNQRLIGLIMYVITNYNDTPGFHARFLPRISKALY